MANFEGEITIDVPGLLAMTQPELDALFSAGTAFTSEIAGAINLIRLAGQAKAYIKHQLVRSYSTIPKPRSSPRASTTKSA